MNSPGTLLELLGFRLWLNCRGTWLKGLGQKSDHQSLSNTEDGWTQNRPLCFKLSVKGKVKSSSRRLRDHSKKTKKVFAAIMAAGCVAAIVAIAVVFGIPQPTEAVGQEGFTLDDVLGGKFYAQSFNGTWISDTEFTYRSAQGGINIFNVATGVITDVLGPDVVGQLGMSSYKLSPDRNYILYSFDVKPLWRYSSFARYSVVDLVNRRLYPLQPQQTKTRSLRDPQLVLRYATWNKQGNGIFYVYENDIYYRPTPESVVDIRITTTGDADAIFNGIPDWVYEEEVLSSEHAMWLSDSGDKMFFGSFDDRQVDSFDYSVYGEAGSMQFQYPFTASIRYPKAGRTNPIASLWLASLDASSQTFSLKEIPAPGVVKAEDHYFTAASWVTADELMVVWVNRHQNVSIFSFCNVNNLPSCDSSISFAEPNGWVDFYTAPKFSTDGRRFLVILPVSQGASAGNYKHVVMYDRDAKSMKAFTSGRFEVTEILGWNEEKNIVYFIGTAEGKPAVRQMYSVTTDSNLTVSCITCGSVNIEGKLCTYNSVEFSSSLRYFVHGCDGPSVPRSVIKETATEQEVFLVSSNTDLLDKLSQKAVPRALNLEVPVKDNFTAQVRLILPPSLNRNKASKYPLLVYVYGGPQSQQVSDRFRVDWGTHLASSRGVIYALIDGRGSGYQGDKMLQQIYRRMGTVEIEDQIAVTKYLTESLPFVDANRTAIWGWSYGGFAAASSLAQDKENVFKCAMSVAPVTNWIYYDSIYTERYMGLPTPEDNEAAYKQSDLSQMAENFRNKRFYLIHGTADDNVHYQQSLMLARSLEAADILFRQQSYTDENHSIAHLKKHLYHSLGAFLMSDCFELENEIWG